MTFHIITIFPEVFGEYVSSSILKRAQNKGIIDIKIYNIRDFANDKYNKVDDKAYGGGPGMVLKAEPILAAVKKARGKKKNVKIIIFSPRGTLFSTKKAEVLGRHKDIILICGRYEGVDARVVKILRAEEISIGPYVLTGGELAGMVLVDTISRRLKGVLGSYDSIEEHRIAAKNVYTRPSSFRYNGKKYSVPKTLLSGNHKKIDRFRKGKK